LLIYRWRSGLEQHDLWEQSGASMQVIGHRFEPRGDDAADVVLSREMMSKLTAGAEVDHDARRAVGGSGARGICEAIGTDLGRARIVDPDAELHLRVDVQELSAASDSAITAPFSGTTEASTACSVAPAASTSWNESGVSSRVGSLRVFRISVRLASATLVNELLLLMSSHSARGKACGPCSREARAASSGC
jgi:hypothetical protein